LHWAKIFLLLANPLSGKSLSGSVPFAQRYWISANERREAIASLFFRSTGSLGNQSGLLLAQISLVHTIINTGFSS
jgi:peroxiredoxin